MLSFIKSDLLKIAILICLTIFVYWLAGSEKELEFEQANPKYPNTGLIEKACLKTGAYCRMIANK